MVVIPENGVKQHFKPVFGKKSHFRRVEAALKNKTDIVYSNDIARTMNENQKKGTR